MCLEVEFMEIYYDSKIETIFHEYIKLFKKMLELKKVNVNNESILFFNLATLIKKEYPELSNKINMVLYYFYDVDNSEEKLEYLMILYKKIKEKAYGQ